MSEFDLAAIEARVAAATEVPWYASVFGHDDGWCVHGHNNAWCTLSGLNGVNADCMAHAPEDVDTLCREVRRLRAGLKQFLYCGRGCRAHSVMDCDECSPIACMIEVACAAEAILGGNPIEAAGEGG